MDRVKEAATRRTTSGPIGNEYPMLGLLEEGEMVAIILWLGMGTSVGVKSSRWL